MNSLPQFLGRILALFLAASVFASAQVPPLLTSGVEVGSSNEKTALIRATGRLSSTVDVKIKNTGDRPLLAPLHAVITFTALNGGNLNGLTMPGSSGGIGLAPYQTFYRDLSASIGDGLAAGAETTFRFTFERPSTTSVSYAIGLHGMRNSDPEASIGGPYSGQLGIAIPFNAAASTDPDGDALTYAWDFGDGGTAAGSTPQHAYSSTGLFTVTLTATDARGAVVSRETQVPIAPPGVFALARTRTLDGNGHPLGEVTVAQTAPNGSKTLRSDSVSGFASLGGAPGQHVWSFARAGHLTSYRKATLNQGQVKVVAFPWLAALNDQRYNLSILNPTVVKSPSERVTLTFPPEAFEQVESVAVTDLHGQSLPLPLPYGWSPLATLHLDMPVDAAGDVAASLKLLQNVPGTRQLALVRLDTQSLTWQTASLIAGTGTDVITAVLRKSGSYAVVIADTLPSGNPAAAVVGSPLPSGDAPSIAQEVTAVGVVNPQSTIASVDPGKVTATATVDFTNAGQPLASGAWFLADVEETYDLADGQAFKTPDYDATFYAYQTPGDSAATTSTATFPMRPRILFGPEQLKEAHIKADVLALNTFAGGILTTDGGSLNLGGIRIQVPPGAVGATSASEIRLLNTTNLSRFLGGFEPLMAFELNLPELADGTVLNAEFLQKLSPDSNFVLARCVNSGSDSGLQPVQRLISDSQGKVTSAETTSGPRLPGITASGKYVLVKINEPQALITGLVRKVGGALLPGALVRVSAEPWLSLTGAAGAFSILAKPGERNVTGSDPADGNSGQATASLANAASVASVEIQTAPTGPRVVSTAPAASAPRASNVAPITVEFSEPIQPGSFGATGIRLRDVAANTDVPGSLSLDLTYRKATLLPLNPLAYGTDYEIIVSNTLLDRQSLTIEGTLTFAFKTAPNPERPDGAQLVIYEPDARNVPQAILSQLVGYDPNAKLSMVVATGSLGTGDPEVPVILVNEDTGESATVLSKPDGSFVNFVHADEDQFVTAVFVNHNGTRVEVAATRQLFDNGRVGLYNQGGILEATNEEAGQVQVIIQPGSIERRSVFKLDVLTLTGMREQLAGLEPSGGEKIVGGIKVETQGDSVDQAKVKVKIPFSDLGVSDAAGLTETGLILATPAEYEGVRVFASAGSSQAPPAISGETPPLALRAANAASDGENSESQTAPQAAPSSSPPVPDGAAEYELELPGIAGGTSTYTSMYYSGSRKDVSGQVYAKGGRGLFKASDGSLRVPGAFVFPLLPGSAGNLPKTAEGKPVLRSVKAGDIGVFSGAQGGFKLPVQVPNSELPIVFAVTPLFINQIVFSSGQPIHGASSGGIRAYTAQNLVFQPPDNETSTSSLPPQLFVATDPMQPAATVPFKVFVSASNPQPGTPPDLTFKVADLGFSPTLPEHAGALVGNNLSMTKESEKDTGGRREQTWKIECKIPASIRFVVKAQVQGVSKNAETSHVVTVAGQSRKATVDKEPPYVEEINPRDGESHVPRSQPVTIRFSKPMEAGIGSKVQSWFKNRTVMNYSLREQNRLVVVTLDSQSDSSAETAAPVRIEIPNTVKDAVGHELDQILISENLKEGFTSSFTFQATNEVTYLLENGNGVVGTATHQFAIDRATKEDGKPALVCFESSPGEALRFLAKLPLPAFPRHLVYLGPYPALRLETNETDIVLGAIGNFDHLLITEVLTRNTADFSKGDALFRYIAYDSNGDVVGPSPGTLTAPFDGKISRINVSQGQSIPPDARFRVFASAYRRNTRNLVAVTGGFAGQNQEQWLQIIDVTDPSVPILLGNDTLGLGAGTIGQSEGFVATKLAWSAPKLGILILGPEQTSILEVDVPLFLSIHDHFPVKLSPNGVKGLDLNGDGDYFDDQERMPEPSGAIPKFGVLVNGGAVGTNVLTASDAAAQRFTDFDMDRNGEYMVACSRKVSTQPSHKFWVLKRPGERPAPDQSALLSFDLTGAEPARVKLMLNTLLEVKTTENQTSKTVRDLAVVGLLDGTLLVLDLTDPKKITLAATHKISVGDGVPRAITVGQDGFLYVACSQNTLAFDPQKLITGHVSAPESGLILQRYVGFGTSSRSFLAANLTTVAVATGANNIFSGDSRQGASLTGLHASSYDKFVVTPKLDDLTADVAINSILATVVSGGALAPVSFAATTAAAYLVPEIKLSERKSKGESGKPELIELVDFAARPAELNFRPDLRLTSDFSPTYGRVRDGSLNWSATKYITNPDGTETTVSSLPLNYGTQTLAATLPGFNPIAESSIATIALLPIINVAAVPALATLPPEKYEFTLINQDRLEAKKVRVHVYSGLGIQVKWDSQDAGKYLAPVSDAFTRGLSPLLGSAFKIKAESKGALAMKAQWTPMLKDPRAYLAVDLAAGYDPFIGFKAEFPITAAFPALRKVSESTGLNPLFTLGGGFSFMGVTQRKEIKGEVAWRSKGFDLGGKMSMGVTLKWVPGIKNPVTGKKYELVPGMEASISAETGISLKGTLTQDLSAIPIEIKHEGLVAKVSLKFPAGRFTISSQGQVNLIEPATLFKDNLPFTGRTVPN